MKKIIQIFLLISLPLFAQDITNKLGASGNYDITDSSDNLLFRLQSDNGLLVNAGGSSTIPATGAGTRLMWYPGKAAFRVGYVNGSQWDNANIGTFSVAMGQGTTASGGTATAMGYVTTASGTYSTAMGFDTEASGDYSTAIGSNTTASGDASTAIGYYTTASGNYSTAMGYSTTASGIGSTAMGNVTTASGEATTAMGYNTTASGDLSTAMGSNVSTSDQTGSFIIGDNSTSSTTYSNAINQMTMRFAGGYRLFTNSGASIGTTLATGANSWTTISDSTKKENFQQADGEYFLDSINKLKLGSWNYKAQDSSIRHYGPMAQEIYKYFGKDDFGTMGNDTTLATADMDGIMMIAIQALIKENKELKLEKDEEIAFLKSEIEELKQLIIGRE